MTDQDFHEFLIKIIEAMNQEDLPVGIAPELIDAGEYNEAIKEIDYGISISKNILSYNINRMIYELKNQLKQ